ncbi:MAG: response regulator [Proteobacteria bacterium]|nr:response regulator [Pseudomonadota bacterium]
MRIRTQIALALSAVAVASFAAAWLIGSVVAADLILSMQAQEQQRAAKALGAAAAAATASSATPMDVLRQFVRHVPAVVPNVQYAFVEDGAGRVLLHTNPQLENVPAQKSMTRGARDYAAAAGAGARPAAVAHVGAGPELKASLLSGVRRSLLPAIVVFGGLGIAVSLILGFGLASLIAMPLSRLAAAADEVGRGDLGTEVPVADGGEIGELSLRFNDMVGRLRELDAMKDRFISTVSHDLRSPLAAIQMSLDFMLQDDPDGPPLAPEHRRTLATVMDSASRLGVFVSNILDAAKMKAGRMEYRPRPVSIAEVIRPIEELYAAAAKDRGIRLSVGVADGLPAVQADPERLERAITNLLANALKFTRAGGAIELGARAAGAGVEVHVADTGDGIPADAIARLFRPFEQVPTSDGGARLVQGTGLGLYIVKESVEAMGGEVGLSSEVGKGTRAFIRLPLAVGERVPSAENAPLPAMVLPSGTAGDAGTDAAGRALRVLVVDDEYATSAILKRLLESKGYAVSLCATGASAAEAAGRERADLVLLDMNLRDMSGLDALRILKEGASTASIPVILCTAAPDLAEVERGLRIGAYCFLPKPVKAGELDLRIRQATQSRAGGK